MTTPTPGLPEAEKALPEVAYGFFGPWIERRKLDWRPRNKLWEPLVRLSDATALLASKDAEIERLRADAERWGFVRHHWSNAQMRWNNDETNSLKSIVLTVKVAHWTSGADALEQQIDAALAAQGGGAHD